MKKYKVTLIRDDYRRSHLLTDAEMTWIEIQRLAGEKLAECQSARETEACDGWIFKGQYLSAGGELLPLTYVLTWEVSNG